MNLVHRPLKNDWLWVLGFHCALLLMASFSSTASMPKAAVMRVEVREGAMLREVPAQEHAEPGPVEAALPAPRPVPMKPDVAEPGKSPVISKAQKKPATKTPSKGDVKAKQVQHKLAQNLLRPSSLAASAGESGGEGVSTQMEQALTRMKEHLLQYWAFPALPDTGAFVIFRVQLHPDGTLKSLRKIKSSGHVALDESAARAIEAASPLPMPEGSLRAAFLDWELIIRPEEFQSI